MFTGSICMEDVIVTFAVKSSYNDVMALEDTVDYTVSDTTAGIAESFHGVSPAKFFKALAIAIHNDGMPDWRADYADAESIMGTTRWIP